MTGYFHHKHCAFAQKMGAGCPNRTFGTVTETAFDVLSVTDKQIYMTRFGAGENRVGYIMR